MAEQTFHPYATFNNLILRRGDPILVGYKSRIRTAWVVDIWDSNQGLYVTANVAMGDPNNPKGNEKPLDYVGTGFYHLTNQSTGLKFILPVEGERAARELNDYLAGKAAEFGKDPREIDAVLNPQPDKDKGDTAELPAAEPQQDPAEEVEEYDPADRNRDGVVTPKEQRKYDRKQREEENG